MMGSLDGPEKAVEAELETAELARSHAPTRRSRKGPLTCGNAFQMGVF